LTHTYTLSLHDALPISFLCFLLLPAAVMAQQATSAVAGVVKDASGALLPGVIVEAASPALIEKVRTAVSDSDGRYRIVNLRPGTDRKSTRLNSSHDQIS